MSVKRYELETENGFPWSEFMHEDAEGDYVLHSDYAALLARHNALVEELRQCKYEVEVWKKKPAMNVQSKYDALVEAVKAYLFRLEAYLPSAAHVLGQSLPAEKLREARAEVDRLIDNAGAADREGEENAN